jgi:pyrroloquinoline quinone biosynthesis protein E
MGYWSMRTPNPLLLIAELSYRCPLRCPYCSNPIDLTTARRREELTTAEWARVFREAEELGVLQLALTGGEPLTRPDLEPLTAAATEAGLYSTLVTSAIGLTPERARALLDSGLDHVQISFQDSEPQSADRIAGRDAFEQKVAAAHAVVALGFPLTINVVLHRQNLDRVDQIIELAEELGARRLELANAQYHGWALLNRALLMPSAEQIEAGEREVASARDRLGPRMQILWVIPDYYDEYPKPCMGGWGRESIVVTPNGTTQPCQAAGEIPGLSFPTVREHPLSWIWFESEAFNRFRGHEWMQEPCRSCPLGRQSVDFGGCRCQAMRLTGDPAATDPVCHLSPAHATVLEQRRDGVGDDGGQPRLTYRSMRRLKAPG